MMFSRVSKALNWVWGENEAASRKDIKINDKLATEPKSENKNKGPLSSLISLSGHEELERELKSTPSISINLNHRDDTLSRLKRLVSNSRKFDSNTVGSQKIKKPHTPRRQHANKLPSNSEDNSFKISLYEHLFHLSKADKKLYSGEPSQEAKENPRNHLPSLAGHDSINRRIEATPQKQSTAPHVYKDKRFIGVKTRIQRTKNSISIRPSSSEEESDDDKNDAQVDRESAPEERAGTPSKQQPEQSQKIQVTRTPEQLDVPELVHSANNDNDNEFNRRNSLQQLKSYNATPNSNTHDTQIFSSSPSQQYKWDHQGVFSSTLYNKVMERQRQNANGNSTEPRTVLMENGRQLGSENQEGSQNVQQLQTQIGRDSQNAAKHKFPKKVQSDAKKAQQEPTNNNNDDKVEGKERNEKNGTEKHEIIKGNGLPKIVATLEKNNAEHSSAKKRRIEPTKGKVTSSTGRPRGRPRKARQLDVIELEPILNEGVFSKHDDIRGPTTTDKNKISFSTNLTQEAMEAMRSSNGMGKRVKRTKNEQAKLDEELQSGEPKNDTPVEKPRRRGRPRKNSPSVESEAHQEVHLRIDMPNVTIYHMPRPERRSRNTSEQLAVDVHGLEEDASEVVSKPVTRADAKANAKPNAKAKAEARAEAKAEAKAKAKTKAKAKAKTEAEAKAKAEAEAKANAKAHVKADTKADKKATSKDLSSNSQIVSSNKEPIVKRSRGRPKKVQQTSRVQNDPRSKTKPRRKRPEPRGDSPPMRPRTRATSKEIHEMFSTKTSNIRDTKQLNHNNDVSKKTQKKDPQENVKHENKHRKSEPLPQTTSAVQLPSMYVPNQNLPHSLEVSPTVPETPRIEFVRFPITKSLSGVQEGTSGTSDLYNGPTHSPYELNNRVLPPIELMAPPSVFTPINPFSRKQPGSTSTPTPISTPPNPWRSQKRSLADILNYDPPLKTEKK